MTKKISNGNSKTFTTQQGVNSHIKSICDIMRCSNCTGALISFSFVCITAPGRFCLIATFYVCLLFGLNPVACSIGLSYDKPDSVMLITQKSVVDSRFSNLFKIKVQNRHYPNNFSEAPTWTHQLFRNYNDRQCFKFSWLIKPSLSQSKTLDSNTKALASSYNTKAFSEKSKLNRLDKNFDHFLAFNTGKTGHSGITNKALKLISKEVPGKSQPLQFSRQAIYEIVQGNKEMDVEYNIYPSTGFYVPCIHFDNEQFHDASSRIIDLKTRIIDLLTMYPQDGQQARYLLGAALHTIQDFYAHTNWVELGFTDIDTRLGREVIINPPKQMHTSLVISKEESLRIYKKYQESYPKTRLDTLEQTSYEKKYKNDDKFRNLVNIIAAARSEKPGILLPNFVGTKDIKRLTSGYFMGIGGIKSCTVPLGKTRHGVDFFGCPEGLNKDEPDRPGYVEAHRLAILATQDYINQILDTPQISQNVEVIKTLMGIELNYKDF